MFIKSFVAVTVAALSIARAIPAEKRAPKSWWSGLESYSTYHARYMELSCNTKHNTEFFDQCCHPRLKGADLSTVPEQCLGSDDVCDDDDGDSNDNQPQPSASASAAPKNVAPSPVVPVNQPTPADPKPSTTSHHTTATPKATSPSTPKSGSGNSGNNLNGSGKGTYFLQNGVAGACGTVHSDGSKVVALDAQLYGNTGQQSKYCGKTIHITNTKNGKSVDAVVADACPTCVSWGSVDMSVGAFTQIATEEEGEVDITWTIDL